ncbi:histidine kinase [Sphingobium aromaticivastans]|uniref:histidine kinase n=1 Tax=Sphingobium aromaticivastans TaxID=1778665 RepID=UPI003018F82C
MMDKSRTRSTPNRSALALLGGCASAIALGWSMPAAAQTAFQGNYSVVLGSASITRGTTDTIAVNGSETVINWTPTDTSGTGTIDFLPNGRTAQFTVNVSAPISDYTVLNRILPVDGNGLPVSRIVALNGTVQSDLFGSAGGKVWFYAPGGIIAGPTSVFNVGSLVLTSNDIDLSGPNGGSLYGPGGEIRFRGVAGSNAAVEVQAGAQINALAAGSYVALVAPRVVQAGAVSVDGSTAYVGAEAADITINGGLFDIAISAGTTDANGVVHSGTTAPPAAGGSGNPQRVYMVAVPKNNALTMLLSGDVGYTAAATATPVGSAIILSAGSDVGHDGFGNVVTAPNATATAEAGFSIGSGNWQFDLTGVATGGIVVRPTVATHFIGNVTLSADQSIALQADQAGAITADKDMTLNAGFGAVGGRIDLLAFGGSGSAATNGQIDVTGGLTLNAIGNGEAGVSAPPPIGADASGGTINLIATGGLIRAGSLSANAMGYAGYGSDRSGNATGGAITLSALTAAGPSGTEGGTLRFGDTSLDASAGTAFQVSLPPVDGGHATGGTIAITGTSGAAIAGGLDLGSVDAIAQATAGVASTGSAGDATGGNIGVTISSGTHQWASFFADVSAAPGYATEGGSYGVVIPGATGIDIDIGGTGKLDILNSVSLYADSRAYGGGASGGVLRGGRINVSAHDGGSFSIAQDLFASADASSYPAFAGSTFLSPRTADVIGGTISIGASGGSFSAAGLYASASGSAGDAPDVAGSGSGGSVTLFASASGGQRGSFSLSDCVSYLCRVYADGRGAAGVDGSNGTGGSVLLYASDADFSAAADLSLHADGTGAGAASDGIAGRGGDGLGGGVTVESRLGAAGTADLAFGNLFLSAEGSSAPSIDGMFFNGGDAGSGTGGTVNVNILGGKLTATLVDARAAGYGGAAAENCLTCEGGGTSPFQAGSGQGGSAGLLMSGGTATIATLTLGAQGTGGEADGANDPLSVAALAGSGLGGGALLESRGGSLQVTTLTIDASAAGGAGYSVFQADGADGGTGTGGNAALLMTAGGTGQVTVDGTAIVRALGKGGIGAETGADGAGSYRAGAGGFGLGGIADMTLAGGRLSAPSLLVSAEGIGGAGGNNGSDGAGGAAGDGMGGTARFSYLNEGHAIDAIVIKADGQGGQAGHSGFSSFDINGNPTFFYGTGVGGAGGRGRGGSATMLVDVDPVFADLTVSADGIGSMGGGGGTGSIGGMGTGGTATLNLAFGATTVSGALRVTASGLGGLGGTGYDNSGGRGGDALGGTATFGLAGSSTVLDAGDIGVLAEALGGAGGQSGLRSGAGLAGADGGDASGGTALFGLNAGASAITGIALRVSGNATGGDGASGTAGPVGGYGGAGGHAVAGSATLRISDAHMAFSSGLPKAPGYSITAVGQGGLGADGSAGSNAGLSGGLGGRGGDGAGGIAAFDAGNGDYVLGGINVLADGLGGPVGIGGAGPGGGSAGGAIGLGSGGTASFGNGDSGTMLPGAQRLIDSLFMSASGDASGLVQFTDSSTAAGGGLRVNGSIALASLGAPVAGFSGISVTVSNSVQIGGNADFTSDGPLAFAFAGTGGISVTGALTGLSATRIDLSHSGRLAGSDSLSADSILFTTPGDVTLLSAGALRAVSGLTILSAGGNINLASGSELAAGGDARLFAQGRLNGTGAAVRAAGTAAIGLGGAGDILLGDLASGTLLDQVDASGNLLGMGGIAIGGDFAVSGRLDIGAGSGTLSAATIDIGILAAGSQQLTASSGTVRIGNALMSGDLIVNSSLLLGNADIAGLLQVRAPAPAGFAQLSGAVAAGSIDIDAGVIASNGLTARNGGIALQSATDLTVVDARASGAIVMTANGGLLMIGSVAAGGNLTLTGLGINASSLTAGGQSLLNAGAGNLIVSDIASAGTITANGGIVSLGATGAMNIAQANASSGPLTLNAGGVLSIVDASSAGDMTLGGGVIAATTLNAGGLLTATSTGDASFNSVTSQTGAIVMNAGALLSVFDASAAGNLTLNGGTINATTLNAVGLVTATSTGDASFTSVTSQAGAIVLNAGALLSVFDANAAGNLTLNGGTINATTLNAVGRVAATATANANFGSVTSQTGDIVLNAGGLLGLTALIDAGTITLGSSDIVIGGAAQIGGLSRTSRITFNAVNLQQPAYIGGNDVAGTYSLSAAELARIAAADLAINAPARGVSGTPDLIVQDLTLGTANLAGGGVLAIGTSGHLRVQGAVRLMGRTGQGGLTLSAGQALEVVAGPGLIDISDGNGGLGGLLTLASPSIIVATLPAIADVAAAGSLYARELRLARNDGLANDAGMLRAGTIRVSATQAFFIQNSGVSTAIPERRGFTAGNLVIDAQGTGLQIAINGQLALPAGGFARGLETIPLVAVNGAYALGSKVNGCLIGNPAACLSSGLDSRDTWNGVLDPSVQVGRIFTLSLIELRDIVAQGYPPLIDEPVTGAGNEDLWERSCGRPDEPACDAP